MTSSTGSAGVFEPQQVYPLKAAFSTDLFLIPVQETICSKDTHCVFKAFGPSLMARHFQSPLRSSNELSFFFFIRPFKMLMPNSHVKAMKVAIDLFNSSN